MTPTKNEMLVNMQVYALTRDAAANFSLLAMVGFNTGALVITFVSDRLERRKPGVAIFMMKCSS